MDTDSGYLALSVDKLDDVIKPHMKEEYEKDKYNWFPNETTKELKTHNKRTPGLFKVEFEGNDIYVLCSKLFFVEGETKNKYSWKGIQKNQKEINKDRFHKHPSDTPDGFASNFVPRDFSLPSCTCSISC